MKRRCLVSRFRLTPRSAEIYISERYIFIKKLFSRREGLKLEFWEMFDNYITDWFEVPQRYVRRRRP